jgi:hypothetical protein
VCVCVKEGTTVRLKLKEILGPRNPPSEISAELFLDTLERGLCVCVLVIRLAGADDSNVFNPRLRLIGLPSW